MIKRILLALALLTTPAWAALSGEGGSFLTGTGTTQIDVVLSGAFQPTCVIFWTTANGEGTSTNFTTSWGAMCDQATDQQRALWAGCRDAVDPSSCEQIMVEDRVIVVYDGGASGGAANATLIGDLRMASFNANGFSVTPVDAFTSDSRVFFIAIGGTTNVDLRTLTLPVGTGTFDTTGPNFQPDFLMLAGANVTAVATLNNVANFNIGCTDGTNSALFSISAADNGAASALSRYMRTGAQVDLWASALSGTSVPIRVDFDSFLATGYRLNVAETTGAQLKVFALALDGGVWAVGDVLTETSLTTFTETHAAMTGKGIGAIATGMAAQSTSDAAVAATSNISIGFASTGVAGVTGYTHAGHSATANDQYDNVQATNQLGVRYSTTPAIAQSFDFNAFTNSTTITFEQTDADTAQTIVLYFVFGDAVASTARKQRRVVMQ